MLWWAFQNFASRVCWRNRRGRVPRRVGPVTRHALWLIVPAKLVTPPLVVVPSPWTFADHVPPSIADATVNRPPIVSHLPVVDTMATTPWPKPPRRRQSRTSSTSRAICGWRVRSARCSPADC
jgi:beta-lactamase regulating signal transducer with metallopeptidase domain